MVVVAFEQGRVLLGDRVAVVQRIAAVGSARPWPPVLDGPTSTQGTLLTAGRSKRPTA
jgi:hypothetical protein